MKKLTQATSACPPRRATSIEVSDPAPANASNYVSFYRWLNEIGRTKSTGHRWRKMWPWLRVVNVQGKLMISRETIAEFERRAEAGELAKESRFAMGAAS